MRRLLFAAMLCWLAIGTLFVSNSRAAVFQFTVTMETKRGTKTAYLWIPPNANQVRGVVVGGMTLMERELAQDPVIRSACRDQQLAIMFMDCGLKAADPVEVLRQLAKKSGYTELAVAPLLFVGHSAGGPQARLRAFEFPSRCFGLIQYRGADPGDVDRDGREGISSGIPALQMVGQFDEFGKIGRDEQGVDNWEKDRDKLKRFREKSELNLASFCVEPGAGHFAWSQRNAEYVALFIRKAAEFMIPPRWPIDAEKVTLQKIDPRDGWCTDLDVKSKAPMSPAPYDEYSGDPRSAAWHFDKELALANVAYHVGLTRADQFIYWRNPHRVESGARNFFQQLDWDDSGMTFQVAPEYSPTYPEQVNGRGSRWARAGMSVGHCDQPIRIKKVSGPISVAGDRAFRFEYDELAPATKSSRATFMAYSKGDQQFRYTERVGMISSELCRVGEGKAQDISFDEIDPLNAEAGVRLNATSSAGLPVRFHVGYGPVQVVGATLELTEVPVRAKWPIEACVIAYQFGRPVQPKIQTARPVKQVIKIYPR